MEKEYYESILKIVDDPGIALNITFVKFGLRPAFHIDHGKHVRFLNVDNNSTDLVVDIFKTIGDLVKFDNNLIFEIDYDVRAHVGVFVSIHHFENRIFNNIYSSGRTYNTEDIGKKLGYISPGFKGLPDTTEIGYMLDDDCIIQEWVENSKLEQESEKFNSMYDFTLKIGKTLKRVVG